MFIYWLLLTTSLSEKTLMSLSVWKQILVPQNCHLKSFTMWYETLPAFAIVGSLLFFPQLLVFYTNKWSCNGHVSCIHFISKILSLRFNMIYLTPTSAIQTRSNFVTDSSQPSPDPEPINHETDTLRRSFKAKKRWTVQAQFKTSLKSNSWWFFT